MEKKQKKIKQKQNINLDIEYEIEVMDSDGNVIKRVEAQSDSLVKNFLTLLNAAFRVNSSNIVDTDGITHATGARSCRTYKVWYFPYTKTVCDYGGWRATAPEGDDTYGIIVGTGDQPVMITISSRRSLMATPPDSCIITQRTYMIRP